MSSPVSQVVTIREAAYMYCVSPSTIRYHLDRGKLTWRKSAMHESGIYLIDLLSLKSLYGEPVLSCNLSSTK